MAVVSTPSFSHLAVPPHFPHLLDALLHGLPDRLAVNSAAFEGLYVPHPPVVARYEDLPELLALDQDGTGVDVQLP